MTEKGSWALHNIGDNEQSTFTTPTNGLRSTASNQHCKPQSMLADVFSVAVALFEPQQGQLSTSAG